MQHHLVLTLIGPDRPGLVERVARVVADHGGNWLDSRMARLGGQFAGIVRVDAGPQIDALADAVQRLDGLQILVARGPAAATIDGGLAYRVEIVGADRPGIVREISAAFAASDVNVEELHSRRTDAPMSGTPLFEARADVRLHRTSHAEALRERLESIAADLVVDLTFRPAESE